MSRPCSRMTEPTLVQRLHTPRERLLAVLPGDPGRRMLRSWHTRYQRALEALRRSA